MKNKTDYTSLVSLVVGIVMAIIGIIVYTFLFFPNINGVLEDISWYNYDIDSEHYIYWFGFWSTVFITYVVGSKTVRRKSD